MNVVYCSTLKLVLCDPVRNLLGLFKDNGKENGSYHIAMRYVLGLQYANMAI